MATQRRRNGKGNGKANPAEDEAVYQAILHALLEGKLRSASLPTELRNLIEKLSVGEASVPIVQKNGVGIVMVCSKNTEAAGAVTRQEATEQLIKQRLDTLSRRYLRDLRRAAYVDVRV